MSANNVQSAAFSCGAKKNVREVPPTGGGTPPSLAVNPRERQSVTELARSARRSIDPNQPRASFYQLREREAFIGRLREAGRAAGIEQLARRDVVGRAVDRADRDERLAAKVEHRE